MAIVGPLPGGLPPPPGDRCRFLGRGVFVNPGGGPSHDLHDNDGASGAWPSSGCALLQQCGYERVEEYKCQE